MDAVDGWKWLPVIIGILGAVVGVYFRESYRRALLQKRVAMQLDAYLTSWQMFLLKTELRKLVSFGEEWHKELAEAFRTGGRDAFAQVYKKQQEKIKEMKSAVILGDSDIVEALDSNRQTSSVRLTCDRSSVSH
jgi:hypothetical protein